MALNIKNDVVEGLVEEVARLAGESKTEAVKKALEERMQRLLAGRTRLTKAQKLRRFLEFEAWPQIPTSVLGTTISKAEEESILGYDHGVQG